MATKDWIRKNTTRNGRPLIEFKENKKYGRRIIIWQIAGKQGRWRAIFPRALYSSEIKIDKYQNKDLALLFAKAYMRTH